LTHAEDSGSGRGMCEMLFVRLTAMDVVLTFSQLVSDFVSNVSNLLPYRLEESASSEVADKVEADKILKCVVPALVHIATRIF